MNTSFSYKELVEVAGESRVWTSLLGMLPLQSSWVIVRWKQQCSRFCSVTNYALWTNLSQTEAWWTPAHARYRPQVHSFPFQHWWCGLHEQLVPWWLPQFGPECQHPLLVEQLRICWHPQECGSLLGRKKIGKEHNWTSWTCSQVNNHKL